MAEDYKEVLITIVSLYRQDNSAKVRRASVAKRVKMNNSRLNVCLDSLKHAQYIKIEKTAKLDSFITPTILGIETADTWKSELRAKTLPGVLLSSSKWLGAGLATALLALLLWYFRISPDTIGLQPFDARVPIRVYDLGTFPSNEAIYGWFAFSPQKNSPVEIGKDVYIYDENERQKFLGNFSPATLLGDVYFFFAVENIATKYQVDIQSVDVIARIEEPKSIEDVYVSPMWGLGGANVWDYMVSVSPNSGEPLEDGSRLYHATLVSNDKNVDYILIDPEKREKFSFNIHLEQPGRYILTPVLTYSFRNKTDKLDVAAYTVVYPLRYRSWVINPYADPRVLDTSHMVVNKITGEIQQEKNDPAQKEKCLPQKKWIFFTSTMIQWGMHHQTFVIDTDGENLRLLNSNYYNPNQNVSVAWTNNGSVLIKFNRWTEQGEVPSYELFNPKSGEKLAWTSEVEKTIIPASESANTFSSIYITPDGKWTLAGGEKLTISNTNGSCVQIILKPNIGEIRDVSLQP